MEGLRLPPLRNVVRLIKPYVAVDSAGRIPDLEQRLCPPSGPAQQPQEQTTQAVAILVCRGGDFDNEAPKLQLLAETCRALAEADIAAADNADSGGDGSSGGGDPNTAKQQQLQVVLLASSDATEATLRAALNKLPASGGEATAAATPPEVRQRLLPWIAVACVPSEAEVFGDFVVHLQPEEQEKRRSSEMLVLLLDILGSTAGGLALFEPVGAGGKGLARDGADVLKKVGIDAWPFSEARVRQLLEGGGGGRSGAGKGGAEARAGRAAKSLASLLAEGGVESFSRRKEEGAGGGVEQVPVAEVLGGQFAEVVGFYFGADWCEPCEPFATRLTSVYDTLREKKGAKSMAVIFVSFDANEAAFDEHIQTMPASWLALPFSRLLASVSSSSSDPLTLRDALSERFEVRGIPSLALVDGGSGSDGPPGRTIATNGRDLITELGDTAHPFSPDAVAAARAAAKAAQEKARAEQTLSSLLCTMPRESPLCDWLVNAAGARVGVAELAAKRCVVGLLFSSSSSELCQRFSAQLKEVYEKVRSDGAGFEIVLVSADADERGFESQCKDMAWLAVPFSEGGAQVRRRLRTYFDGVRGLPGLVVLDAEGKTRTEAGVEIVRELGAESFPFTTEKLAAARAALAAEQLSL